MTATTTTATATTTTTTTTVNNDHDDDDNDDNDDGQKQLSNLLLFVSQCPVAGVRAVRRNAAHIDLGEVHLHAEVVVPARE